jgi:hypothetical protein
MWVDVTNLRHLLTSEFPEVLLGGQYGSPK